MNAPAYYNEHDPYAAQWLRNLIHAGHIAPGIVDERSIEDVFPSDLRGFTQCHFFAGIGVWSYALRLAGWADDRPIWTGSCPCQPFSQAGEGAGFDDERHLWPAFFHLIRQCQPAIVVGEQVASKDADPWIDLVQDDVEGVGYRFGAVPFPAAGVGAPHIRDRLYWVADSYSGTRGKGRAHFRGRPAGGDAQPRPGPGGGGMPDRVADACCTGLAQREWHAGVSGQPTGAEPGQALERTGVRDALGLADASVRERRPDAERREASDREAGGRNQGPDHAGVSRPTGERPGSTHGFWSAADWLLCRDGRWRPVEPGTFPLVDAAAARVGQRGTDWHTPAGPQGFGNRAGRLKGYGNAINAEAARVFLECVMEAS